MKRKIIENVKSIIIVIIIAVVMITINEFYNEIVYNDNRQMEEDIKSDGYECLFGDKLVNIEEEQQIIEIMYPGDKKGVNFVYYNTEYKNIGDMEKLYDNMHYKVKFKVTSYDYSLAYKNGVKALNKYMNENKNASKEDKERYFAERLQYEGQKIRMEDVKEVYYIDRCYERIPLSQTNKWSRSFYIILLPWQKDDMDLANAVTGGLVEEMDKTKLPKGINLEDTLRRVDREYEQERFI